jgi:translation initiation factor IF-3
LETRVHQAEKFIKKGDKVKVDMVLRGREKGLSYLAKDKIGQFIDLLEKVIPIKVEGDLKKSSRGFTIIISGDVKHEIGNMEQETGNRKH